MRMWVWPPLNESANKPERSGQGNSSIGLWDQQKCHQLMIQQGGPMSRLSTNVI